MKILEFRPKIHSSILVYFLVLLLICAPVFQSYEYNDENNSDDLIQQRVITF